jgi:hypothetical protein
MRPDSIVEKIIILNNQVDKNPAKRVRYQVLNLLPEPLPPLNTFKSNFDFTLQLE